MAQRLIRQACERVGYGGQDAEHENTETRGGGGLALKIVVDREKCQGIGACVGAAPDVFEIDSEGKAIVLDAENADKDEVMLAAEACPLEAISLFDENGEQIYP